MSAELRATCGICGVVVSLLGLLSCAEEPARRPNVIVIVVDALRADALGANGYPLPTTPNLDRLIADGALNYSRAYAHSTWTKPSIATLFTSVYPAQHGIDVAATEGEGGGLRAQLLAESWTTLAEAFSAAGYQTAAVLNQVHLDGWGFTQGFDSFISRRQRSAGYLNAKLFEWFDTLDPERPFFAYLHYLDAHWPYDKSLPETRGAFGPTGISPRPPKRGVPAKRWVERFDELSIAPLRARYDREVSLVDSKIQSVWRQLEIRGWSEQTVLVVTADHGEGFLEHGQILHGYAPYEEVARVPLVIRLPARLRPAGGVETSAVVGLVDLMPTLLELAEIELPAQCQGVSLLRDASEHDRRREVVYSEGAGVVAARTASHTVLRWTDGSLAFFDRRNDPGERHPLPVGCAGCGDLARRVEQYARALAARSDPDEKPLSAEAIEELTALGYL